MRNLSNLLSRFVLLSVVVAAITFTYFNTDSVTITFGTIVFEPLPVSAWIIGAFVLGSVLGLLLGLNFLSQLKIRAQLKRMSKDLENARREVKQLRNLSLRDLD